MTASQPRILNIARDMLDAYADVEHLKCVGYPLSAQVALDDAESARAEVLRRLRELVTA